MLGSVVARSQLRPRYDAQPGRSVGEGLNNREIDASFFMAEATVKTHIGRILAKLGLRDRVHMVVLAYETGLVAIGEH